MTPLNPLKGPAVGSPDEMVPDEMRTAFFEYLAADTSGDQIILIENVEPSDELLARTHHHVFSKNDEVGRYGFFPRRSD